MRRGTGSLAAVLLLVLGLSRGAAQAQEPGVRVYLGPIRSPAQEAGAEYAWRQTSGPAATLSDPHARRPFFAAREPGEYAFELIVRGGGGTADRQIVTVAVGGEKGEESAPVHSWTGEVDRSVTLDAARIGVAARPDSTYIWRQIAGPCTVTLAFEKDASPAKAYFTPPEPGRYVFGLLAGGRRGLSPVGRVAVAVAPRNRPPAVRAWAKEEAISLGSVAELLAQANDPEGNPVSYRWRQVAGPKAGAMDGLCGPRLRVRLDEEGLYAFSAVANDGRFDGEPAYVTIRALKRSESLRLERARREKELVGLIESSDAGLLVPFVEALGDENPILRAGARRMILGYGWGAVPALIGELEAGSPRAQIEAAGMLEEISSERFGRDAASWRRWIAGRAPDE